MDLWGARENMWICRVLGIICGSVGCLGECVDLWGEVTGGKVEFCTLCCS